MSPLVQAHNCSSTTSLVVVDLFEGNLPQSFALMFFMGFFSERFRHFWSLVLWDIAAFLHPNARKLPVDPQNEGIFAFRCVLFPFSQPPPPFKMFGCWDGEGGAKRLPFVSQRKEGTHLMMTHLEKAAFYILPHCTVLPTISSNLPRDTPAESLRCHVAIHSSTTQLTGFWPLDLIGRGSRIGPKLPKAAFFSDEIGENSRFWVDNFGMYFFCVSTPFSVLWTHYSNACLESQSITFCKPVNHFPHVPQGLEVGWLYLCVFKFWFNIEDSNPLLNLNRSVHVYDVDPPMR